MREVLRLIRPAAGDGDVPNPEKTIFQQFRAPVRWLINLIGMGLIGWLLYVIYSWWTWTGVWPTVANWTRHKQYVTSSEEVYNWSFTFMMCVFLVLILGAVLMLTLTFFEWKRLSRSPAP